MVKGIGALYFSCLLIFLLEKNAKLVSLRILTDDKQLYKV
jgi:hypothetical protein